MLAFSLRAEQAELFFTLCGLLDAKTENERTQVLVQMAKLGCVQNIVATKKSKEEYIDHLAKNFKVLRLENKKNV